MSKDRALQVYYMITELMEKKFTGAIIRVDLNSGGVTDIKRIVEDRPLKLEEFSRR